MIATVNASRTACVEDSVRRGQRGASPCPAPDLTNDIMPPLHGHPDQRGAHIPGIQQQTQRPETIAHRPARVRCTAVTPIGPSGAVGSVGGVNAVQQRGKVIFV
jgi:hypothetical protein